MALFAGQPTTSRLPNSPGAEAFCALTRNPEKSTTVIHFLLCLRLAGMEVPPVSNISRKRPAFDSLIVGVEDQKKKNHVGQKKRKQSWFRQRPSQQQRVQHS